MSVESTMTDPYEVVLNDLRAKKAQIDQAINAIEALRGGVASAPPQAAPSPPSGGSAAEIDSPGAFLGMSISDAAKKLLAAKRQPLKNSDIAAAFKRGGLVLNSKDVINTIGSVLSRRAAEVGDVVRIDRGTWGLKEWYPGRTFKKGGTAVDSVKETPAPTDAASATSAAPAITQAMRDKLHSSGASDDDIDAMSPEEALSYLEVFGLI